MTTAPALGNALSLHGKVALVTGATGDIGTAVTRRLQQAGAQVAVHYLRRAEQAAALAHAPDHVFQANLAAENEVVRLVHDVAARLGAIDTLIHCASIGTFTPILATRAAHWDRTLEVHARAFWLLGVHAGEALARSGAGTLIAVSSLGARRFTPAYGAVGVAKGALEAAVKYLAAELGPRVRVNAVAGGPIEGERLRHSPFYDALRAAAAERVCGRFGRPEEIADVVLLLATPLTRWIHGQVLVADGGFTLW